MIAQQQHRFSTLTVALAALTIVAIPSAARSASPASAPAKVAASLPASMPGDEIELQTGITFSEPGGTTLKLDLARPRTGGPYPAVVCLFGGGWISGSRVAVREVSLYLAGYGYVAVAPSYRLAPDHPFPAAVADVRNCVRWIRRNAAKYNIDPQRVGAMGLSAGGHLALMLGMADDREQFGPDDVASDGESARVQAVVNYFGPGDLASPAWGKLAIKRFTIPFLGGTLQERPEVYAKASPITYVTKDDAPVLTFQGEIDRTVPAVLAVELHKKLDATGVKNRLEIIKGRDHGSFPEPEKTRTRQAMVRWLDENLTNRKR